MTELDVWLEAFDLPIGRLVTPDNGSVQFSYAPEYLGLDDAHPISLSLPLAAGPFGDRVSRAFFQNLLPENNQLDRILDREGLDRSDVTGILFHLGADLSGALSCLPAGSERIKVPGILAHDYDVLDQAELIDIVDRLGNNNPLPNTLRDPSPVSGYQRKIALTILPDGRYACPRIGTGAPTTHILKVPETTFPREAFYEARCANLGSLVGLNVAPSESSWIGQYEVVLAQRYDRLVSDGAVYRLHQEDFAQAMGLSPRLKYQRNGNADRRYDVPAIMSVLRQTEIPAIAVDEFLRATIFNLAIGNTDNHAKNHALLYDRGKAPRLAPLYDLVPITLSDQHTHQLSFSVGEAQFPNDVSATDLALLLAQFEMKGPAARRFTKQRLISIIEPLAQARDLEDRWANKFNTELTERSQHLLEQLASLMKTI